MRNRKKAKPRFCIIDIQVLRPEMGKDEQNKLGDGIK